MAFLKFATSHESFCSTHRCTALQFLSEIPNDPDWRFPSLSFDKDGYVLRAAWISNLLTEEQRNLPPWAIVNRYAAGPTAVTEEWNQFKPGNWEATDDTPLVKAVLEQNGIPALMAAIRGH
jgi:hypothetical protein